MNSIESYLTCPFNGSHRILKARYQQHLYKCRKNYPKDVKVVCCYDVTHLLDPDEYQHHLSICPTSGNVKCYETLLEPDQEVGTVPIQAACNLQTNTMEEDWFGKNPTYNPLTASEKKNVFRVPIAMSKSEKKKFKEYERKRLLSLENESGNNQKVEQVPVQKKVGNNEPLRKPKNVAKAMSSYDASILINNISLQLKDSSLDKHNDTLVPENSYKLDNNDSKKDDQETVLINTSSDKINTSTAQKNTSRNEKKEDIPNVNSSRAWHQGTKMEENASDSKYLKTYTNASEKNGLQTNNFQQKLNKYYTSENQKQVGLNGQKGILYGEPKKVSTGRGFILACQRSNPNILKKQEQNKNSVACSSTSDYD